MAAKTGKPILLHPARTAACSDFAAEKRSRYEIWTIFGWPYETSATMARLIFSGVMTRLPGLKVLAHYLGAMIPFFDLRIETGWATLGSCTSDEDYSNVLPSLGKPLLDCFKDFYGGGTVWRHHRPEMRARVLRRRPRGVLLRRAVRSRRRPRLYPRLHGRLARYCGGRQGEDFLSQREDAVRAQISLPCQGEGRPC